MSGDLPDVRGASRADHGGSTTRSRSGDTPVRPLKLLAALAAALMASLAANALPADAAATSASISGTSATLNLDGANDNETVSVSGGLLVHTAVGGGLNSTSDWDS